jgi:hypothetical protein
MPRISIVTATYNRSNVLRHAIETVRWQTCADWELIVVGDGCTDDTEQVVRSFADPRVRYIALPRNHGEQSVPNNAGVAAATADRIAFLNHDDLWFPDHLDVLTTGIDEAGADLAYTMSARVDPEGRPHLWGNSPGGRYEFWHVVPASTWLLTRELALRVGPWTSAARLYDAPSQDWLRRAHAAGARLQPVGRLTAVQITSGGRRRSYLDREEAPLAAMRHAMTVPSACRERLLTEIALGSSAMATYLQPVRLGARALKAAAARAAVAAGVPPVVLFSAARYGRRGGFIRSLRRTRGLSPAFGTRG